MNEHFIATLSLCRKANKLLYGFDTVREAARDGQIYLFLTASDLSPKTEKEIRFLSDKLHIPHLTLQAGMSEIAAVIGKKTGIIGITEPGFSKKLVSIHNETEEFDT